jgi:hypothetical protein
LVKGASYSWEGKDGPGMHSFVKENDSIAQKKMVQWNFFVRFLGLKIPLVVQGHMETTGEMSFLLKYTLLLNGGVDKVIGTMYEKV